MGEFSESAVDGMEIVEIIANLIVLRAVSELGRFDREPQGLWNRAAL